MITAASSGTAIPQLGVASRSNRSKLVVGTIVAASLIWITVFAHSQLDVHGPVIRAFMPIVATIWCFAELLTAFLMLSQFYVAGKKSFAIISAAYATSGLLTIPYLAFFPGVFITHPMTTGDVQVSAWLWVSWHVIFPVTIAAAHIIDPTLDDVTVPRNAIGSWLAATIGSCFAFAAIFSMVIYFSRSWLPHLVSVHGEFSALYRTELMPAVVFVNIASLAVLGIRARSLSPLQMWIAIALLTMTLDAIANVWAPGRYSVTWYIGKFEALSSAVVLLILLLIEVATLYRRLYDVASIDTLTGLPNRRSFNDVLVKVLGDREHRASGLGLMVLDVDNFKTYNDKYGHAAGDKALAAVAGALGGSLVRSDDFVARFGGEEFVILLPDVLVDEVEAIGERVRKRVAKLGILHEASATSYLTISIGAAYCSRHQGVTPGLLFDFADRALYVAKSAGRDCVIVRHLSENEKERSAPIIAITAG